MAVPPQRFCPSAVSYASPVQKQPSLYQYTFAVVCKLLDDLMPLPAFVVVFFFVSIKCKLLRKVIEEIPM